MSLKLLENLNNYRFSKQDIDMLIWWIQTRKRNTWNYLNPLQYSVDCNINIETAIELFLTCTHYSDVKVFDVRSIAKCPNCDSIISTEENCIMITDLPKNCNECGLHIQPDFMDNFTDIIFKLIVDPFPPELTPTPPIGVSKQPATHLTSHKILRSDSKNVRTLAGRMRRLNGK
ncbi:hypothetical protein CSV79_01800 [Sporosarcina sp. P13]|uniref:hypothetical protein n=1 Tax=Sporosarcina sp. P13 TaxID=2048263 RepID=UPI000C1666E9|nr:hypothetical protein [Sporosarcina sp. P13]PIC65379.1 hypothetical protein CSV79_01800 [Sporosarcina sp. P13]